MRRRRKDGEETPRRRENAKTQRKREDAEGTQRRRGNAKTQRKREDAGEEIVTLIPLTFADA